VTAAHVLRPARFYPDVEWLADVPNECITARCELFDGDGTLLASLDAVRATPGIDGAELGDLDLRGGDTGSTGPTGWWPRLDNGSVVCHPTRDVAALWPVPGADAALLEALAFSGAAAVDGVADERAHVVAVSQSGASAPRPPGDDGSRGAVVQIAIPGLQVADSGLDSERIVPLRAYGHVTVRTAQQVFCRTHPAPLEMGFCGAPVIDPEARTALGIIEGVVPPGGPEALVDAAVYVEGPEIIDLVANVGEAAEP
jgi:hypothetical protein